MPRILNYNSLIQEYIKIYLEYSSDFEVKLKLAKDEFEQQDEGKADILADIIPVVHFEILENLSKLYQRQAGNLQDKEVDIKSMFLNSSKIYLEYSRNILGILEKHSIVKSLQDIRSGPSKDKIISYLKERLNKFSEILKSYSADHQKISDKGSLVKEDLGSLERTYLSLNLIGSPESMSGFNLIMSDFSKDLELERVNSELEEKEDMFQQAVAKIYSLENHVKSQSDDDKARIKGFLKKIKLYNSKIVELKEENSQLKIGLENLKKELEGLRDGSGLSELEAEKEKLQNDIKVAENNFSQSTTLLKEKEGNLVILQRAIEEVDLDLDGIEQLISDISGIEVEGYHDEKNDSGLSTRGFPGREDEVAQEISQYKKAQIEKGEEKRKLPQPFAAKSGNSALVAGSKTLPRPPVSTQATGASAATRMPFIAKPNRGQRRLPSAPVILPDISGGNSGKDFSR